MASEHCERDLLAKPIAAEEARDYLWDALCQIREFNGLLPCAPRSDGTSGLVMDFQRCLPNACGEPNRFRITIEPIGPTP